MLSTLLCLLLVFALSLGTCLVLTPLARSAAIRCGLVDRPDGRRKMHSRAIPVAGGLPILLSICFSLVVGLLAANPWPGIWLEKGRLMLGILLAAVLICAIGIADDTGWLRVRHKLLGQLLVVGIVLGFGVQVRVVQCFGWSLELGLLSWPFTAFLLLGAINSLNLIDGMDGLLSTVGLIVALGMTAMAVLGGHPVAALVAAALAGAVLGFLRYNFPPATIFLGDSGSMLIGLMVGVLAIQSALKTSATLALTAPTAVLTIPIFDTLAAILRRKLTGRSIYNTDRGHLHHCLLRSGFTNRRVLLIVAACCAVTGAGALASLAYSNDLLAVVGALVVVNLLVVSRLFGHAELALLQQRVRSTILSFLRGPDPNGCHHTEVRLQGHLDWKELWTTIIACSPRLNLKRVCLDVNAPSINEGYHACWNRPHDDTEGINMWRAEIPLRVGDRSIGRLEVLGYWDREPVWKKMATLAELVPDFELTASALTRDSWKGLPPTPIEPTAEVASPEYVSQTQQVQVV
jgi:UDP-GlcNAc:undecaprenyl-phosphate GlcNAc-1-phosphate transferase